MMVRRALALILAAVLAAALALGYWMLATFEGSRWTLDRLEQLLPGMEADLQAGSWASGLTLRSFHYHAAVVRIDIDQLQLKLRPRAIFNATAGLYQLRADRAVVQLIDDGSPPAEALATVSLPLRLQVGQLRVPQFELITASGERVRADIDTALDWRGSTLSLDTAGLTVNDTLTIAGKLQLQLQGDYPLHGRLQLQGESLPGVVTTALSGSLASLQASGVMAGEFALAFSASAGLLDAGIPLQLELEASSPWAFGAAPPQLAVSRLQLQLAGKLERLEGSLQARLEEQHYGVSTIDLQLLWRDGELHIAPGQWQSDYGSLTSRCTVAVANARWRCQGDLNALSLTPWTDLTSGELTAGFTVGGSWAGDGPVLLLELPAITGSLADQQLAGELSLHSDDFKGWTVTAFNLRAGSNKLEASGFVADTVDLDIAVSATQLQQLNPAAKGGISANIAIDGAATALNLQAHIRGRELVWGQLQASSLDAAVRLKESGLRRSSLAITADDVSLAEQQLGRLVVDLEGHRQQHRLSVKLDGAAALDASVQCRGQERDSFWGLHCETVSGAVLLQGRRRSWHVAQELDIGLSLADDYQLTVQPVCVRMDPASLCLRSAFRWDRDRVDPLALSLHELPLDWWGELLSESLILEPGSALQADLRLDSLQPLQGRLTAGIDELAWRWQQQVSATNVIEANVIETLKVSLLFDSDQAQLEAAASSASMGSLQLQLEIDDPAARRTLDGRLTIKGMQLQGFSGLVEDIDRLEGGIDGDISLAGSLQDPVLGGGLGLRQGLVAVPGLPYPVENINASLRFQHHTADFDGTFKVNEGSGILAGNLRWQNRKPFWQLQTALSLDAIAIALLEDSTAEISTQLDVQAVPGVVDVTGKVAVNRADIQLHALPPESVSPSADSEIVGSDPTQQRWQINSDIDVDLGNNLRLRGFGADLKLEGELRYRNSPRYLNHMLGEVRVASGRYRAYGQRLRIRKGSLLFAGALDNPDLQLEAVRESRTEDILAGLRVTGSLQQPLGELFSEPAMSETDIAHFILTGRKRKSSETFGNVSAQGTLLTLGLAGANQPAAELAQKFGITDFQISAENGEAGLETTVGGYLTPRLYVSYGTLIKEKSNTVTLRYHLTPRLVVEAVSGFSSALDFIYNFSVD